MTAHPHTPQLTLPVLPRRALAMAVALVGTAALVVMVLAALRIATAAAVTPKLLVPSGRHGMPGWMAGPFRGLGAPLDIHELVRLIIVMAGLYAVVLLCSRWIPAWVAIAGTVVLVAIFTVAPPLFSTDIFNYVAYARMGALYHVNPYVHGAAAIFGDPSVPFTGPIWLHTSTDYEPPFTLMSYASVR